MSLTRLDEEIDKEIHCIRGEHVFSFDFLSRNFEFKRLKDLIEASFSLVKLPSTHVHRALIKKVHYLY